MAHEKTVYPADFAKSCANCKFCDTINAIGTAQSMMVCRQKAPGSQGQCIGVDPANGTPKWVYTTLWPMVGAQDWCGDYARKVNS